MGNAYCRFDDTPQEVQVDDSAAAYVAREPSPLLVNLLGRFNPRAAQTFEDVMRDGPIRDPRFGISSPARNQQRKHMRTYFRGK